MDSPETEAMRALEDSIARTEQTYEQYAAARRGIEALTAVGRSRDGVAQATVRSSGAVVEILLTDRARSLSPQQIAADVLAAVQQAQSAIVDDVESVLRATVDDEELTQDVVADARAKFARPPAPRQNNELRLGYGEDE